MLIFSAPKDKRSLRSARKASYSDLLFDALNPNQIVEFKVNWSRVTTITPVSLNFSLEKPSTYSFYSRRSGFSSSTFSRWVNSSTKSISTKSFIILRGQYSRWYSPNSIEQVTSHPEILYGVTTFFRGCSIKTLMLWAKRYGLSFLAGVINDNASFSRSG